VIKILYVEDNEMNRDMLSRRLELEDFEVVLAEDGAEGLKATVREKPDLILMDLDLPIVDGWEATRRLKDDDDTKAIPIIALSAHAMAEDIDRAFEAGCNDYDTKPVDIERLVEKIQKLVANK